MADIRHKLTIKVSPEKVYEAITTREGLEGWWCKNTTAKPEIGLVNTFTFGDSATGMKIVDLVTNKKVEWKCIEAIEEWVGTTVLFQLEEKDGGTILRFIHADWRETTDMFDVCSYHWAMFLNSLKSLCEKGTGTPA